VIALGLAVLLLLDGCFSGFRASAGRDGRVDKRAFARRACLEGTVAGLGAFALLTAGCLVALGTGTPYAAFTHAGTGMLAVFVPYGLIVLAALAGWVLFRPLALQTLMSTLVLGPFTLIRPLIVVVGCAVGLARSDSDVVGGILVLSCVLVLAVEPLLLRCRPPQVPPTLPSWTVMSR
jgi:hypothetical protein